MYKRLHLDTVDDQVYHILRNDINMQVLEPGCRINENKIAEELNVSRSPVREALKRLKGDGLVVTVPNKGSFVRKLNAVDVNEMYEARVMFEVYALQNVALPPNKAQLEKIRHILKDFIDAYNSGEIGRYLIIDREFHAAIIELTQNRYICDLYNKLNWQINVFRTESGRDADYQEVIHQEHLQMCDFVLSGKYFEAADMLPNHIRRGAVFIIKHKLKD